MTKSKTYAEKGLILALCLCGFGAYSDNVIIPLLNHIFTEYPNTSLFMQNYIITGSAVASIVAALLASILMRYISKRTLLIWGTVMFIIGGVSGCFAHNMLFLALARTIDAASDGLLGAVAISLIVELFQEPLKRGKVIGWSNACSCIYGIIASFLAGIIALYHWRAAFLNNGVAIITLILIVRYIPQTEMRDKPGEKIDSDIVVSEKKYDKRYKMDIVLDMVALLIMGSCGCQIYFLMDLYVAERGLGTSVLSGTMTSVITFTAVLTCVIFARVCHVMKKYSIVLMFGLSATSLLIFSLADSSVVLLVGGICAGVGQGAANVYFTLHIGNIAPPKAVETAISLMTAMQYGYMFLGPYLPTIVRKIIGDGSINSSFYYTGLAVAFCGIGWMIYTMFRKRPLEKW